MAGTQPKWKRRPEERPVQIMDAALHVFARRGFRAATMDEVAREAGITKGTIYLYFKSKEDLFVEMVRAKTEALADLLPALKLDAGTDLESVAREAGKLYLDTFMNPDGARLVSVIIGEFNEIPALRKMYLEEIVPKGNMQVAQLLSLGMDLGMVRRMDPVIAARCLFGMFFVFVLTQEVFGAKAVTPMNTEAIVETIIGIYSGGVFERGEA